MEGSIRGGGENIAGWNMHFTTAGFARETVFTQYVRHPEYKSLAPDGNPCKADSHGLLRRYPVTASGFHLIGKETERGWEQTEVISTLLPSLKRYGRNIGTMNESLR